MWRLSFYPPPPPLGIHLPPPPCPLRRKNGPWSLRISCLRRHDDGGRPWSSWPLSRPSSSAPCRALGPASSLEAGRPVLQVAGPDSRSAPPSLPSPKHFPKGMRIKHMNCQHTMTYRTCWAGQLVPAVLGGVRPRFAGLEKHLPNILVGGAKEL